MTEGVTTKDTDKARIFYPDGRVDRYEDQKQAYSVFLALPKQIRAAFRGRGDSEPVYPHDYVDGH